VEIRVSLSIRRDVERNALRVLAGKHGVSADVGIPRYRVPRRLHGHDEIAIEVMRGTGSSADWKVQFVRIVRSTGERQIWSYAPAQSNGDDVTFAGRLTGMVHVDLVQYPGDSGRVGSTRGRAAAR
jgi:hypothetical protein